ncbi:hypothetical protein GGS23DRAFT_358195 [Durotheca rogersii]|uniref:uncharacterized protein n=1 Tax=Durotheca rogersii TaxID=419775 RepID=UPI002220E58B|nr:uncharacterized protein GGS23DRAFT_358195 [Durotheca rogersii]KAI5865879.1 hypothetical protein GGS23DRAFT_358195 [Durotheca rogersii]
MAARRWHTYTCFTYLPTYLPIHRYPYACTYTYMYMHARVHTCACACRWHRLLLLFLTRRIRRRAQVSATNNDRQKARRRGAVRASDSGLARSWLFPKISMVLGSLVSVSSSRRRLLLRLSSFFLSPEKKSHLLSLYVSWRTGRGGGRIRRGINHRHHPLTSPPLPREGDNPPVWIPASESIGGTPRLASLRGGPNISDKPASDGRLAIHVPNAHTEKRETGR